MKHTPGPWKYRETFSSGELTGYTIHYGAYPIADILDSFVSQEELGEAEANARLIAAAPESNAVCGDVVRLKDLLRHYFKTAHITEVKAIETLIHDAEAAIAKAEGRGK